MKPFLSQSLWAGPAVSLGGSYHLGLFVLKLSFKTRNTGTGANGGFYTFKNNNNRESDWKRPSEFAKALQRGRGSRPILMLPGSAGPGLEGAAGPDPRCPVALAAVKAGQPFLGGEQPHTTKKAPGRGIAGPAMRPENERGGDS